MGASNFSVFTAFKAKDGVSPVLTSIMGKTTNTSKNFARLGSCIEKTNKQILFLMKSFAALFAIGYAKDFYLKVTQAADVQLVILGNHQYHLLPILVGLPHEAPPILSILF